MKNHSVHYQHLIIILFCYTLLLSSSKIFGQTRNTHQRPYIPVLGRMLKESEIFHAKHIKKKPGHYTMEDWRQVIDDTWGPGMFTSEKLRIFDEVWEHIDKRYGGFVNHDVNIDSLRNIWRPEIESGVSRGRFAAIMTNFIQILNEGHTSIYEIPVIYGTALEPGIPIFVIGHWFVNNRHFGAVLTPLPDSSLVVLRAVPNHSLNLTRGDIVLGYDGVPWKQLYKELLEAELPIRNQCPGGTKESTTHIILASAGLNWHLFDTIDIVKHSTNDTLHLPTSSIRNQYIDGSIWGNEHLEVPGVPMPDYLNEDYVSWGIVDNTQIGYIYVGAWFWDGYQGRNWGIGEKFYNAVYELMFNHQTKALIIDFRCNAGGGPDPKQGGYSLLFNERVTETGFVERGDPNDHYDMGTHSNPYYANPYNFSIQGDPATFYNKPIAVLTGPAAASAADWSTVQMAFHPMVRTFGKPSNGMFSTYNEPDLGNSQWYFRYANGSGILLEDPNTYLIHTGAPVDERVWFTKEDVIYGDDTVVDAAITWINGITAVDEIANEIPAEYILENNYPNPFNPSTTINYSLPQSADVSLRIYNSLGQEIKLLVNEFQYSGYKSITWDGTNNTGKRVRSGIYFYKLKAGTFSSSKKMILMK
ncbi:T9SS type A sorting domain-containing protein [Bacteroidota bacterium]